MNEIRDRGEPLTTADVATVIYTDGACKGNPGPGGWAWAVEDGRWESGYDPDTTNQRMEITAAYRALRDNPGRVHIVSDSTYVVNCFRDGWWKGWRKRGWKNSKKEPVANRDLWEPFVDLAETRQVTFEWVKGHSGHDMNDLVDLLAVAAVERRGGSAGSSPDDVGAVGAPVSAVEASSDAGGGAAIRDRRVPEGTLWTVVGLRSTTLMDSEQGRALRDRLSEVIHAQGQLHHDLIVLTGLRPGAEQIGAIAATDAEVPYVAVLPYPDPVPEGPERDLFDALCASAERVVTLEAKVPADAAARAGALARRDGWLRSVSSGALVVTPAGSAAQRASGRRGSGRYGGPAGGSNAASAALDQLARFQRALGDDVWEIPVETVVSGP